MFILYNMWEALPTHMYLCFKKMLFLNFSQYLNVNGFDSGPQLRYWNVLTISPLLTSRNFLIPFWHFKRLHGIRRHRRRIGAPSATAFWQTRYVPNFGVHMHEGVYVRVSKMMAYKSTKRLFNNTGSEVFSSAIFPFWVKNIFWKNIYYDL